MAKRDSVLIKCDAFFCFLNNIKAGFQDKLKHRITAEIKQNRELRDNGKDVCFVIGNGPSLKNVDLSLLEGFDTITVNGFYLSDSDLKSTYHVLIDNGFNEEEHWAEIENAMKKNSNLKFILEEKISPVIRRKIGSNYKIITILAKKCMAGENIEIDMTKDMTGSANVIPVAIECAMYMGYRSICLLGCDFSLYTQVRGKHFYTKENANLEAEGETDNRLNMEINNVGNLIRCALIHKQHYAIEKKSRELGIKILNATEGSLIDAYDFVNLKQFIESL